MGESIQMKRLFSKRPSPALVISLIALFVAMGGTGYAVSRNSVGTRQLKKNAVTTSKIRKNAVTTSRLADNAVTGAKALESSFGKVQDADKLDGLDSAAYEKSSKFTRVATFSLGNGETRVIAQIGPVTLTAACLINFGGGDLAQVNVTSSQDHVAFDGKGNSTDLTSASPATDRQLNESDTVTGTPNIDYESGAVAAPDCTQLISGLWAASGLFQQADRCQFGGIILVAS